MDLMNANYAMPNVPPGSLPKQMTLPTAKQPPCTTPNNTVYINNLNEKIKIPDLKQALSKRFSECGEILDVVAHANLRMRGQAFVVFRKVEDATKAIETLQHQVLFDKPMVLQYSKGKSDAIAVLDGTIDEHKRRRLEVKEQRQAQMETKPQPQKAAARPKVPQMPEDLLPPNQILFLQRIPPETTDVMLKALFSQYPGFKEVRMVPTKQDIAFVEYENEVFASSAKEALNGYQFGSGRPLRVTFARK
ncbi:hypothetical protein BZG36_02744 [Bifiguratus adelaidae]|uniref:RRM domain-containing protein n=1 Tax=Bifiguratus adelaidae TaxID=1938954 RepID=A0A261XZ02_9FUNG|nr:hypothetical protein BZG36_02744 [Bifiguratus adelaidae]